MHKQKVTERAIDSVTCAKRTPSFNLGGACQLSRMDIAAWLKRQAAEGLDVERNESGMTTGQAKKTERK